MGMNQSRRCYRCKAIVGWNTNLCGHCEYREGNNQSLSENDSGKRKFSLWHIWPSKQQLQLTGKDNRTC